jgi:hypothetical protein
MSERQYNLLKGDHHIPHRLPKLSLSFLLQLSRPINTLAPASALATQAYAP